MILLDYCRSQYVKQLDCRIGMHRMGMMDDDGSGRKKVWGLFFPSGAFRDKVRT